MLISHKYWLLLFINKCSEKLFHAVFFLAIWVILLGATPPPGLWFLDGRWLMDTVYKTKSDFPALSPEQWGILFYCLFMTCEQVCTFCNKLNWVAFLAGMWLFCIIFCIYKYIYAYKYMYSHFTWVHYTICYFYTSIPVHSATLLVVISQRTALVDSPGAPMFGKTQQKCPLGCPYSR